MGDWGALTAVGTLTYDLEIDRADPDAIGLSGLRG